ncbi:hypothetical protein QBC37DRAFT_423640 [Rhypophila decipiens]|uniref:Nephrocystin 3-like N-terminal domain-containing protein n=1 Tax=Rhypophila decipiens TaxID=261697 RepID=A0AAN6Y5K0_9PEZI|nr:hypothetical protein QBC37DRAFT_423640 [Rhypophila decipiens]
MADPFGIIGVVGVATQVIQTTVQFGLDWKDAPSEARTFIDELQAFKTVLSETNMNIIVNPDFEDAFRGRRSTLLSQLGPTAQSTDTQRMVSDCHAEMRVLLDNLKKRSRGHRVGWERLKGAFLSTKTREAVGNLHRQCQPLNQLLAIDSAALIASTHREVKEGQRQQQQIHRVQYHVLDHIRHRIDSQDASVERKTILEWLTPIDYTSQQIDFIKRRQSGTGQWLLDSRDFQEWLKGGQKTLFCPGIPEAGKTILTAVVIEYLINRYHNDPTVGIAYIYCNFRQTDKQTLDDLLASLLRQLAESLPPLPQPVTDLYERHKTKRTRPSTAELSKALQGINAFSRAFVLVDALDECQTSNECRL